MEMDKVIMEREELAKNRICDLGGSSEKTVLELCEEVNADEFVKEFALQMAGAGVFDEEAVEALATNAELADFAKTDALDWKQICCVSAFRNVIGIGEMRAAHEDEGDTFLNDKLYAAIYDENYAKIFEFGGDGLDFFIEHESVYEEGMPLMTFLVKSLFIGTEREQEIVGAEQLVVTTDDGEIILGEDDLINSFNAVQSSFDPANVTILKEDGVYRVV